MLNVYSVMARLPKCAIQIELKTFKTGRKHFVLLYKLTLIDNKIE